MSGSLPSGLHSPPESNFQKYCESDSELSDVEEKMKSTIESHIKIKPSNFRDGVPVFTPTMDQFYDFEKFISAVNPWGMTHGIAKIIPPKEWLDEQPTLHEEVKKIKIRNPYIQEMNNQGSRGASGNFRQLNLSSNRTYNIVEWRALCDQLSRQPPARRGETRKAPEKIAHLSKKRIEPDRSIENCEPQTTGRISKISTGKKSKLKEEEVSVNSRRNKYKEDNNIVDEEVFRDFDYNLYEEFDDERCQDLEVAYWKHISYAPPIYGGDMPGTLFTDKTKVWDLRNLPGFLNYLDEKVPGINTTYLYIGSWKSTFSWHLEDVDLYSINYLHFGAPKQWYSISQGDRERFEKAMAMKWPDEYKHCNQFLRHKTFQISPAALWKEFKIKVNKIVHRPGEFMITFPYGYHAGYNLGYNCAEAVNFAVDEWIPIAEKAKRCDCAQQQDSVWVDLNSIRRKLPRTHKWYLGDPDEDFFAESECERNTLDIPTPPHSGSEVKLPVTRKRKIHTKKIEDRHVKRRVPIRSSEEPPCILCPNFDFEVLKTDNGKHAHRICGEYIPETSVSNGIVQDINFISKARMGLKCIYCRSKRGACFQCSSAKCTRAYHGTCAAASGVLVQKVWSSRFAQDGTEYKEEVYDFRCRFHRPRRDKKLDEAAISMDRRILEFGSCLKPGEICQIQLLNSDIFAGTVVTNNRSEDMVVIKVLFDHTDTLYEIEYKWLLAPPLESSLPKPSANAIPMPVSFKAKESLNTCIRQVNDLPRPRDKFVESFTWAEFVTIAITNNPDQVKVDLTKDSQIWYYIGKTSTEAKAHYTDDLKKPWDNSKGHFLSTVPKSTSALFRHSNKFSNSSDRSGILGPLQRSITTVPKTPLIKGLTQQVSRENPKKILSNPTPDMKNITHDTPYQRPTIYTYGAETQSKTGSPIKNKSRKKALNNSTYTRNISNLPSPLTPISHKKQPSLVLTQPNWPPLSPEKSIVSNFHRRSILTPSPCQQVVGSKEQVTNHILSSPSIIHKTILPNVPPDTSTLIERMMNNLKKACSDTNNKNR
ncbi:DNA damage-responsive transcriptional repressor RPH1 [Erysiphe necator]|nr:DNA damage-responsive transcriptional repressor RPH1 [Erysiphe necator]